MLAQYRARRSLERLANLNGRASRTRKVTFREELKEFTAFERYAIRALSTELRKTRQSPRSVDLRGNQRLVNLNMIATFSVGGGMVDAALAVVRPLLFGAAYKVIDQMIELALENGNLKPKHGTRWTFEEKIKHASHRRGKLPPLTNHSDLWDRTCALYVGFEHVRHTLVHRSAHVDKNGALVGVECRGTSAVCSGRVGPG